MSRAIERALTRGAIERGLTRGLPAEAQSGDGAVAVKVTPGNSTDRHLKLTKLY